MDYPRKNKNINIYNSENENSNSQTKTNTLKNSYNTKLISAITNRQIQTDLSFNALPWDKSYIKMKKDCFKTKEG